MFIFYTILYLVLLYFSYFFAIILPHQAFIFSAIRECYFVYLFFLLFYKIVIVKQARIDFSHFNKLICSILFFAIPYIFISNYLNYAFSHDNHTLKTKHTTTLLIISIIFPVPFLCLRKT